MAERQPPSPPSGYRPAQRFTYPAAALAVASLIVLAMVLPLLLVLTARLQRGASAFQFGLAESLLGLFAVILTVLVHELIHGLAFRLYGYRVRYGILWQMGAAYAGAFEQFQRRDHVFVVVLAPLVVLTAICLPALGASSHWLALIAFVVLLMNTSGAVGDIYLFWRLLRMPPGTLLYDVDDKNMFVFEPDTVCAV